MNENIMKVEIQRAIIGHRDEVVYFERRLNEARTQLTALLAQIGVPGLQIIAVPQTPKAEPEQKEGAPS